MKDVSGYGKCGKVMFRLDFGSEGVYIGRGAGYGCDVGTCSRECEGGSSSDASRGACNEDNFSFEGASKLEGRDERIGVVVESDAGGDGEFDRHFENVRLEEMCRG